MAAILGSAIGFIDGTIVAIALPAMRESLGATLAEGQWINNAYLLPLASLILLGGALGDRFGLSRAFAGGLALFVAGSLGCAVAPDPDTLIAARAAKGIGAAVMVPQSLALIARAYPGEARGRAIGIWAAASALTTALGPVIGGAVLSLGGPEVWRWLFAANLPLGGLAIWLLLAHVAHDPARPEQPLDLVGAALVTGALALTAWGLTGPPNGTALAVAGVAIAAFLAWEARAPSPMIPLALFRDPTFAAANLATALIYFALTTILFFLPMTLIAGWGLSEALASLAFTPLSAFIALLSARSGSLAHRHGPGKLIGIGGAIVALAFATLALLAPARDFWLSVLPGTTLLGLGMALVVSPLTTAIMGAAPPNRTGTASGINNAVTRVAGLVAVAVMGGIAGQTYLALGGPGSFGAFSEAPGHAEAMTAAYVRIAWITAGLSAAGAVIAWTAIPKPPPAPEAA